MSAGARVVLGLGSSRGDRLTYLRAALRALKAGARVEAVSPIYESDAMLPEGAPESWQIPYLNLCVALTTERGPEELLDWLKAIERKLGRQERERWAPREIDLDILTYDDRAYRSERLQIPHPGLTARPFALLPLADLVPSWGQLAAQWRWDPAQAPFGTRRTSLSLTEWVGILNVTPDSFSDGGEYATPERALAQAEALVAQGATVIDVGAESTRPGASIVSPEDEWRRLAPLLEPLRERLGGRALLSLDTRHAATARRALRLGIDWLNDVGGFEDAEMRRVAAESGATLVAMHSLSVPPRAELTLALDSDPVDALLHWGERKLRELEASGVARERVILDPGIGFGKTPAQNVALLREARRLHALGVPLLFGHSRKSFLARLPGARPCESARERDAETAALSARLAAAGVEYLRVHDVELNRRVSETSAWVEI